MLEGIVSGSPWLGGMVSGRLRGIVSWNPWLGGIVSGRLRGIVSGSPWLGGIVSGRPWFKLNKSKEGENAVWISSIFEDFLYSPNVAPVSRVVGTIGSGIVTGIGGVYSGTLTCLTWVVIDGIAVGWGVLFLNDWGDEKNSSNIVESLPCCKFVEVW